MRRQVVFIAGPYAGRGEDVVNNIRHALGWAETVLAEGHTPFVPHLFHLWHMMFPHDPDYWKELDNRFLTICTVLLRIPGESQGADAEVVLAKTLGIPVAYNMVELREVAARAK